MEETPAEDHKRLKSEIVWLIMIMVDNKIPSKANELLITGQEIKRRWIVGVKEKVQNRWEVWDRLKREWRWEASQWLETADSDNDSFIFFSSVY